jgi:pilus assembly protein CpaE
VSNGIKLVSSDPQLAHLVEQSGTRCTLVGPEALTALARVGASQPEVLIVDLREQAQFPPALATLKQHYPGTAVLLVLTQLDPAVMLEAMRAGVNECVVPPISITELQAVLKRLRKSVAAPTTAGDVFAFIGAKGGVGATTVAVNVATALAKAQPDSTLLVDLNMACGDAAVFLGDEPRFSIVDAVENVHRLDEQFFRSLVVKSKSGVELLGAGSRPLPGAVDAGRIRAILEFASHTRRYTVLDVPRSDPSVLDALELATQIVVVANQELATVRSAGRMVAALRQRYGQHRLNLVLTRTDRRAEIGHDDVQRAVGLEIRHTFPSDYRVALQAMNKGRPVVLDNHNQLSGAFASFAKELAGIHVSAAEEKVRSTSVFGRLAPRRA